MSFYEKHLFFCTNMKPPGKVCCGNNNAEYFAQYCREQLVTRGLHGRGKFRVSISQCLGRCASGPCLVIYPEGAWYRYETEKDIDAIIEAHCIGGVPVTDLLLEE
ncbi:MAG: (2Fe-2S) ferredoxin domain-containing protein [Gammaproteobacteria bacterium]